LKKAKNNAAAKLNWSADGAPARTFNLPRSNKMFKFLKYEFVRDCDRLDMDSLMKGLK